MTGKAHTNAVSALACAFPVIRNLTVLRPTVFAVSRYENSVSQCPIELRSCSQHASMPSRFMSINECGLAPVHPHVREGGGVRSGPGEARTILLLHIISVRPSKQPLMVRTFLKVYMELGSSFLFLREQIKDIIIIRSLSTQCLFLGMKMTRDDRAWGCNGSMLVIRLSH